MSDLLYSYIHWQSFVPPLLLVSNVKTNLGGQVVFQDTHLFHFNVFPEARQLNHVIYLSLTSLNSSNTRFHNFSFTTWYTVSFSLMSQPILSADTLLAANLWWTLHFHEIVFDCRFVSNLLWLLYCTSFHMTNYMRATGNYRENGGEDVSCSPTIIDAIQALRWFLHYICYYNPYCHSNKPPNKLYLAWSKQHD